MSNLVYNCLVWGCVEEIRDSGPRDSISRALPDLAAATRVWAAGGQLPF